VSGAGPSFDARTWPPAHKLIGALAFVVAASQTPRDRPEVLLALLALLTVVIVPGRIPLRAVAKRWLLLAPFLLFAAAAIGLARHGLAIRSELGPAAGDAAFFLARSGLCLLALVALAVGTSERDFLAGLRSLRLPGVLVSAFALAVRYVKILAAQGEAMVRARDCRGMPHALGRRTRVAGSIIGSLWVRSLARAERLGQAMVLRGYDGRYVLLPGRPARAAHLGGLIVFLAAVGAAWWFA
jgi:cobalt/nickel transport system permease protein